MDACIGSLWDCLPNGNLFCLVLAGTELQPGALMFNTKTLTHESDIGRSKELNGDIDPADVYASMYDL